VRLHGAGALVAICAAVLGACSAGRPQQARSEVANAEAPAPTPDSTPAPTPAPQPAAAPAPAPASAPSAWVPLTPKIRADRARGIVEFDAVAVLEVGFLEQLVCLAGTREHEALFAFDGKASDVHAALLLVGLEPGAPGHWREVKSGDGSQRIEEVAPRGPALDVAVVLPDGSERAIDWFVRAAPFSPDPDRKPPTRFVFAGSRFERSTRTGAERYVADSSGSLVGLVTFGDETIGCVDVIPDQAAVAAPVWEAWSERMPKPGTDVKIRLRRGEDR
jgi:hypothetical protein